MDYINIRNENLFIFDEIVQKRFPNRFILPHIPKNKSKNTINPIINDQKK